MAHDPATVDRFRNALGAADGLTEKRMMGGLCFMLNGNMIGGADRTRDGVARFMFRVGKANQDRGEAMPGAISMVQGGRTMGGFFFVEAAGCDDGLLADWVRLALSHASSLPEK
ncbi:TfoX/Sxy family protein [uncultured Brevundimonas sp.]|uniref:TfoX/Sxy family protein n=1 Tax=uncultured Brevundimonas sp. TaxID=213418 RepID=UPI0030EF7EC2|tara:strand:+ start:1980 stop:2321 length:342 start_codon:yes stop_codon:yes gene_type:complete